MYGRDAEWQNHAMTTPDIRIGVIGCGNVAQQAHIPAILRVPGAQLAAVSDPFADLPPQVAKQFGLTPADAYSDHLELLKRNDIDAVSILSITPDHERMAIDAMRAGKHVLVEKPMSVTADEARRMVQVSEETGRILMVAFNHTYDLAAEYVKGMLDRGELGDLIHCEVFFYNDMDAWDAGSIRGSLKSTAPRQAWWPKDRRLGLIHFLHNFNSHTINLMRFLIGEPQAVEYSAHIPGAGIWSVLGYPGFKTVFKTVLSNQRRFEKGIEICGKKKRVRIDLAPPFQRFTPGTITIVDAETQQVTQPLLDYRWPFELEYEHFVHCVQTGSTPRTSGRMGIQDIVLTEQLVDLAMKGV